MKRTFWILLTPMILLIVIGFVIDLFIFPKVSDWALGHAKKLLRQEAHLELSVGSTALSLHRLSVFLQDIKVEKTTKEALPGIAEPVTAEQVQIRLDLLGLLLGQLKISAIVIDGLTLKIDVDSFPEDKSPPKLLPINDIFKWTAQVPIEKIALRRSMLSVVSKKLDLTAEIKPLDALLANHVQRLTLRLYTPSVSLSSSRFPEPASVSIETLILLERNKLILQQGQIMGPGQTLIFSGSVDDPAKLLMEPAGQFEAKFSSDLAPLHDKIKSFFPQSLQDLSGKLKIESELAFQGTSHFHGQVNVETNDIQIGEFEVGSLETVARVEAQEVKMEEVKISHPAGHATLHKTSISLKPPFDFKSHVDVAHLDLQRLFKGLGLDHIPVWLTAQATLPCEGHGKDFELNCSGELEAQNLVVKTGMREDSKVLVEIPQGRTHGQLHVDLNKVSLKTMLELGDGKGPVEGEVGYKTGFDFKFKTDSLDFHNVKQLVGLDFKGETNLDGFTRGDSKSAILSINTKVKNLIFEKYNLGQTAGLLKYEKGHLRISQLNGALPNSTYHGDLDVNLTDDRISGTVDFPKTDLNDIVKVFENIYAFPIDLKGSGAGHIDFSGPFSFWKMSYNLTSQFHNGQIQTDGFSTFIFNVKSENGLMQAQQVELRKGAGLLKVTGSIQPDQRTELKFEGSNLRLEESEMVSKVKNNLIGALNFNGELTGSIFHPELNIKGHLAELLIDEQELPSSFFQFKINREAFEGNANLFGNKIQGDFKFPVSGSQAPLRLRVKTLDWNFASVLSIFGASQLQEEYESQLTSDFDLSSESGDWTVLTGNAVIKNFFLKRGTSSVRNPEPMEMQFNKGAIILKKFHLNGPNTDISINGQGFSFNDLDVSVAAQSDLRLVHILVPFLEDLGGPFQLQATLSGSYKKPEILGNASIDNAFIKLKGFPHPAEKLKADIVFSHSKIMIQNIHGFMASGNLTGDGTVSINGINDIPTMIKIRAEGLNLNVPDKVKSQGNADLTFSGHWFPFVLGGVYNISSGFIEKEFGDGGVTTAQVRDSIYLPKVLKEAAFDPVILDLQVNLERNVVVKNSLMDGTVTGQVQVKGPPNNPILLGKITLDKNSKLMFKSNVFEVQTGTVTFNNPDEIGGELYISAQARVSDYDVNMLVQGPSKNPTIKLSSIPPLPDQEIISLLALGVTSEKLEQSQSKDQASRVGYEAGAVFLNQIGVNKGLQNSLGVNFELTSSFDNTKNVSVPRVTFKKTLSRKWSTSYSQGIDSGQGPKDVKLQYQINPNWSGVGSWEGRDAQEGTTVRSGTKDQSVFGLDLEFKREFK